MLGRTLLALRAPLVLVLVGAIARDDRVQQSIALSLSSEPLLHKAFYLRLDYWLAPWNLALGAACALAALVLFEVRRAVRGANRDLGADVVTAAICLMLAAIPALLATNIRPGRLQMMMSGAQVLLLWGFMMANAPLWLLERVRGAPWMRRVADLAFPIADLFFHAWHRRRLAGTPAAPRCAPPAVVVLILLGVVVSQGVLIATSRPAERIRVALEHTYFVAYDRDGFWFSAPGWNSAGDGIWRYDDRSGRASQVVQLSDAQRFHVDAGRLYAYDRASGDLLCVDTATGRRVWRTPLRRGFGTIEVLGRGGLVFAVAEGGYIAVTDTEGVLKASRVFPYRTRYFQPLSDGRVAFVGSDPTLQLWDAQLTQGEAVPFPLAVRRASSHDSEATRAQRDGALGSEYATGWSDCDAARNVLYLSTVWGEVFRYDAAHGRWLPSVRVRPGLRSIGVDAQHGVLLAASYHQASSTSST